ncbi:hypothetical protein DNTS_003537 [Danionella cerebrum]|uniref:Uncharacterized protein n=1 Tax=Danionella cerebrum TaxID=2873325 RepID=A0A553QXL5_9TELE|nr:hypothetical protein DNTS_003537 [Danionella translucida]
MEHEGLQRSLDLLADHHVELECMVTNPCSQIQSVLHDNNIKQANNVCHLEKGLSKKLEKISQDKGCQIVKQWLQSIKKYMYWTAASSQSGEERVAKWTSLINHIQDVHTHDNTAYPQCDHPVWVSKSRNEWFLPGTKALAKVEKLLTSEHVLKDVENLSPHFPTSLESFSGVIQRFAPKNMVYPYIGMLCRLYLAAMHFNENVTQASASTGYVTSLMSLLFDKVFPDPYPYMEELLKISIPESL